jgi:hypothetical protein
MYKDNYGIFFGRLNRHGDVMVLHVGDGAAVTRMDCNIYPVGANFSVQYEHPEGIVISRGDADSIGLDIEDDPRRAAAIMGRKGGSVRSEKKSAAAQENGRKGGRPRKGDF